MASGKPGVHVVQLKPIQVHPDLVAGYKFIKWEREEDSAAPVTLRVDEFGCYLYWEDQYRQVDYLEITGIRDTRTGRYAQSPRDKIREAVGCMGQGQTVEEKTITVVYGPDMVNVSYVNFTCNCKEVAQLWADQLIKMAYNLLSINASSATFLRKAHIKILLQRQADGKIPVKNIAKLFAQHKDDKKRIETALEKALGGLPTGKRDSISPAQFNFQVFETFYRQLVGRTELKRIFEQLSSGNRLMNLDQLKTFINQEQRDPRLNEILYPYIDKERAKEIVKIYEPNPDNAKKGLISVDGLMRYLMSDENAIISPEKFDLNMDMDQPYNHYFVNSSHNTYLTGHQLTGKSSVEMYRQSLLMGCRCVELDCWNGKNEDEPIITHGYTVVTEILLKDVLEAINESAFKNSDYPVCLSFENHCSPKQQAKIAQYCRKVFGEKLIAEPISGFPLKPGVALPSPRNLLRRVIIKNKKKHYHVVKKTRPQPQVHAGEQAGVKEVPQTEELSSSLTNVVPISESLEEESRKSRPPLLPTDSDESTREGPTDGKAATGQDYDETSFPSPSSRQPTGESNTKDNVTCDTLDDLDSDSSVDEEQDSTTTGTEEVNVQGTASKEAEPGNELSQLVLYIQPVRFHSFEVAEKRNRSYEISSFVENTATSLLKERPVDFVNLNKRQLTRIYPRGTRVDSSNYMPQVFWNAGCQMVALNFQTLDLGLQLNLGLFEFNGRSGYLLKPDFMRRPDRSFDPFIESTVDGIIAGTVKLRVISGQFLTDKKCGTYVEVEMYGLPADTVRRRRTRVIPANGINPIYDDEAFVFQKVVLPDMASLRIAAYEDSGKLIGHRILPVVGLRPGYRHISLRNECGQPLTLPTLFVHVTVKDYIPDSLSELADALANPIAYQSMVAKRTRQLEALTGDEENQLPVGPGGGTRMFGDEEIGPCDSTQTSHTQSHRVSNALSSDVHSSVSTQTEAIPLPTAGPTDLPTSDSTPETVVPSSMRRASRFLSWCHVRSRAVKK